MDVHAGMLLNRLQVQAAALWNAINQRSILLPAVFVFLWQVTDLASLFFQTSAWTFLGLAAAPAETLLG